MEFISQSADVWGECPANFDDSVLWIEKCGRTCFSDDTEILTENGWKNVQDISKSENIWTYNKDKNELELECSNIFRKKYKGKMIQSIHRHSSFYVTLDHRMVAKKAVTKKEYGFVKAVELTKYNNNFGYRLPLYFEDSKINRKDLVTQINMEDHYYYSGSPTRKCVVKGKRFNINDDFLTIIAAYVSDGHINRNNSAIFITKGKEKQLVEEVINALDNLKWKYKIRNDRDREHILSIRIDGGKPLGNWFEHNCGRGSLNKKLPNFWKDLSQRQMKHLLTMLYLGDGKDERGYSSSSKKLIDQINHLYVLIGKSGSVLSFSPRKDSWTKNKYYITNKNKRNSIIIKPNQVVLKNYKGKVYCPQTKNGIVCMRRNGQTLWIGNCYRSEDKIIPGSGYKFVNGIWKKRHYSVIEHSNIVIRTKEKSRFPTLDLDHVKVAFDSKYLDCVIQNDYVYIGGNWRAWAELLHDKGIYFELDEIIDAVGSQKGFVLVENCDDIPIELKRVTVEFVTDRAVSHEFVRHRPASYSQESQRYCRYGDLKYVYPHWWYKANDKLKDDFIDSLLEVEEWYNYFLTHYKLKAEEARAILPNQVATKMAVTASVPEWNHIFNLRVHPAAYGQFRNLLVPVKSEFEKNDLIL